MLWNTIKASLRASLSKIDFDMWIEPLVCRRQSDEILELTGPDRYFCAGLEENYLERIKKAAWDAGQYPKVTLGIAKQDAPPTPFQSTGQLRLPGVKRGGFNVRSLHPAYTFDQFMVGQSNLLARSACSALASADRTFGNCLFLNSSTGLGKSHLTQAVAHEVMRSAPGTRLHYLTAQQFSAEMVKGIRSKNMEQFSRKYINECDMLMIEDVHTLKGKTKTQEELNTVLDYLIKAGRRVIFTSSVDPRNLQGLDEDFRSRMASGLVAGIEAPDYDTRVRIIGHKTRINNIHLDEEMLDLLAKSLCGDVRRVESAVLSLKAKASLQNQPVDLSLIREVLGSLVDNEANLTPLVIRDIICNQFNVSTDDLRSRSRKKAIAFPRQVGMYLSRKYTPSSLSEIGNVYNRDHSTVLYSVKAITKGMSQKVAVREQMEHLTTKLESGKLA